MIALRTSIVLLCFCVIASLAGDAMQELSGRAPDASLYAQAVQQMLPREFSSQAVSYLLVDGQNGAVLASHWDGRESAVAVGSLVKPFVAIAYARAHQFQFPQYVCRGTSSGCWRPRGHGRENISAAIANSCNTYFRKLAGEVNSDSLDETAREFGLDQAPSTMSVDGRIGVGAEWKIAPLRLAHAYMELAKRKHEPAIQEILLGMRESARHGTAAEVARNLRGEAVLAKTGTAPCAHSPAAPGDGFAVALFPADSPVLILLVRVHGVPGSKAAITAGQILRRLEDKRSAPD